MLAFTKHDLAKQFMVVSFLILLIGMAILGSFLSRQIENGVIQQTSAVTALYVDSFVSPHIQSLVDNDELDSAHLAELGQIIQGTSLGQEIVSFKIWSPDGRIVYSPNKDLIGRYYEIDEDFQIALSGQVSSEISNLDQPEHEFERSVWSQLIETLPDSLKTQIETAQIQIWMVVGIATLTMYFLLTGIIGRASNTIISQQNQLSDQISQLSKLLSQNKKLHARVKRAARRTTALNEQFLHRISSDLHDGPIQDISLALLRVGSITEACEECQTQPTRGSVISKDLNILQTALELSLKEIRSISAGLRLPELEELSPEAVARRAVRDYQRKTKRFANLLIEDIPKQASMPVKITLYRVLQEALFNGFRHADGKDQVVRIWGNNKKLHFEVSDNGISIQAMITAHILMLHFL